MISRDFRNTSFETPRINHDVNRYTNTISWMSLKQGHGTQSCNVYWQYKAHTNLFKQMDFKSNLVCLK